MNKIRCYIAGKLNDDAENYIKNVHKMVKHAEIVRSLGCAVFVPCNDFIHGAICGSHSYDHYFNNNISWLIVADAVALVPGWEESEGTKREIKIAKQYGIPVFENLDELEDFIKNSKPTLLYRVNDGF